MSFFRSFKKRLTNQFIAVVIEDKFCKIKQKIIKNGEVDLIEETFFEIKSKDELSGEVVAFLNELQENYKHTYIALFLNTPAQGVIPGCDESKLEEFNIDKNSIKTVCVNNKYLAYASNIDIKWLDKTFNKVGIDFIFSPFLVLDFYKKDENSDKIKMYILNTTNTFALMIVKNGNLLFGSFFNIEKEENLLYTDYEEESKEEEFEEFEQIEIDEKLDDDSIDEVLEDIPDDNLEKEELIDKGVHFFEKDERYIKYLNAALKEFYSNELYDSDFIEDVRIYDDNSMSQDIIDYMKNQLLLNVSLEKINIKNAIIELATKEVFG